MARQDVTDAVARLQRGIERVDRGARNAKGLLDALQLQDQHGGFGSGHLRHGLSSVRRLGACCRGKEWQPGTNRSNILFVQIYMNDI